MALWDADKKGATWCCVTVSVTQKQLRFVPKTQFVWNGQSSGDQTRIQCRFSLAAKLNHAPKLAFVFAIESLDFSF